MTRSLVTDAPRVLYFGCWNDAGHFLHDPRGRHVNDHPLGGLGGGKFDGPFVPDHGRSGPEGVVRYTRHPDGYTILGFRDNSIDSRPASHATFVIDGDVPYADALDLARAAFPFVFERIEKRGINLVREAGQGVLR